MKIIFKILGYIVFLSILLVIIGGVVLVTLVNPNDFKGKISEIVHEKTNRDLQIGNISWSFFPWLGVKLNNTTLGNAPGFSGDFLKIGEVDVRVRLLPLFGGQVKTGKLILKDSELYLEKNQAGETNWSDFEEKSGSSEISATTLEKGKKPISFTISSIEVSDTSVFWHDLKNKQDLEVSNIQLQCSDITRDSDFPVVTSFSFKAVNPDYKGKISFQGRLNAKVSDKIYDLNNANLSGELETKNGTMPFKLLTDFVLDLKKQTFAANNIDMQVANMHLTGQAKGEQLGDHPEFAGSVNIPTFNPRQLLIGFGLQPENNGAWQKASLKAIFNATPEKVSISSLYLTLDETILQGSKEINLSNKTANFNLTLDKINLDRYSLKTQKAKVDSSLSKLSHSAASRNISTTPEIAKQGLWKVSGDIAIGQISAGQLAANNVKTHLTVSNNIINFNPLKASIYGGLLTAQATINMQKQLPQISVNADLANGQLGLLTKSNSVGGNLNLHANVNTSGSGKNAILRNLNGNGNLTIVSGTLKGVDINFIINTADALLHKLVVPKNNTGSTTFSKLSASFSIKNGVLSNNDLLIQAPSSQVDGQGTIDLPSEKLNYRLRAAKVLNGKVQPIFIPIVVTGTFGNLSYLPDFKYVLTNYLLDATKQVGQNVIQNIQSGVPIGKNIGKTLGNTLTKTLGVGDLIH